MNRLLSKYRRPALALAALAVITLSVVWYLRATSADARLAAGRAALRAGDHAAFDAVVAALESAGLADHALLLRAEDLFARGDYGRAVEILNGFADEGPLRLDAAVVVGNSLVRLGRLAEAEETFAYVLSRRPDDVDAHRGLAVVAYDLGNLPQAGAHLDRVAELDPADGRAHRLKGLIHLDLEQYESAEQDYREALRRSLKPAARAEACVELARTLSRLVRHADALAVLDERAAAAGENDDSRTERAEALAGLGRVEEAASLLDAVLARPPKDARPHALRSRLYLGAGDAKHAVASAEAAARLAPADHLTRNALSRAYAAAGRPADAARELARAEELRKLTIRLSDLGKEAYDKPRDPAVRRRIAEVCDRMERPELAAMWRRAAEALERK